MARNISKRDVNSYWSAVPDGQLPLKLRPLRMDLIRQFQISYRNYNKGSKENENAYIGPEVLTAVTMKNVIFWDVALCTSCQN
jgi:hypothetical protein